MYREGAGVQQELREAARWYRAAAERGEARAQNNLGNMYVKGQGVPQDYVMAHKWFNLSGANGNENGLKNRDKIAKEMTGPQLAEAQRLARNWHELKPAAGSPLVAGGLPQDDDVHHAGSASGVRPEQDSDAQQSPSWFSRWLGAGETATRNEGEQ
jgi:TPR repeat protein